MGRISAVESITLDGVMQAPGRADEDTRGGFVHGGWAAPYADHVAMEFLGQGMGGAGDAMLFGRRTYEDVLHRWTTTTEPNPFTDVLVKTPKLVVSRSSGTVLEYPNSRLLAGEALHTVAQAAADVGGTLVVLGSGELVRALHAAGLVDEYVLQIHPIVLGSGTRLFADGERANLTLVRSVTSTTGVLLAKYAAR
ncbi:deaminase [Georgenia yuyongxinii]|uniref:Deaminase n=2 Tax=Georgenia yuyongxinii TaxID=2589797 RepID=A0A552WW47_9MICO|nr:deaminase [Georgenia yuyongxinii]